MLKVRSYLVIALLVYLLTVLSGLPASFVLNSVTKQTGEQFVLQSSSGTVWKGSASGLSSGIPVTVNWDWHVWKLLLLKFSADVHVKSEVLEAKSLLTLGMNSIEIEGFSGLLKADALSAVLANKGVKVRIENDIYIQNVGIKRKRAQFVQSSGKAEWQGGWVYAAGLPEGKMKLPAMVVKLSHLNSGLLLAASEQQNPDTLVEIELSHEGIAHLKLRERVDQFVELPEAIKSGDANNVMFEIKRQIFNTQGRL